MHLGTSKAIRRIIRKAAGQFHAVCETDVTQELREEEILIFSYKPP